MIRRDYWIVGILFFGLVSLLYSLTIGVVYFVNSDLIVNHINYINNQSNGLLKYLTMNFKIFIAVMIIVSCFCLFSAISYKLNKTWARQLIVFIIVSLLIYVIINGVMKLIIIDYFPGKIFSIFVYTYMAYQIILAMKDFSKNAH